MYLYILYEIYKKNYLPVNAITVTIGNNSSTLISAFGLIKSQHWNVVRHVIGGDSLTKDLLALIFEGWRCNNNSFIRKPNYMGKSFKNSGFTKFLMLQKILLLQSCAISRNFCFNNNNKLTYSLFL